VRLLWAHKAALPRAEGEGGVGLDEEIEAERKRQLGQWDQNLTKKKPHTLSPITSRRAQGGRACVV
jgi:hypothetical protein